MGSQFTFYDYVDGRNLIHAWLAGLPASIKVKFNKWLLQLEGTESGHWKRPLVDTLTGQCAGLFEIRVTHSRIHYRILACHGPEDRKPTLLHGFIKPGRKVPASDCYEALQRKERVYADPASCRDLHNYD